MATTMLRRQIMYKKNFLAVIQHFRLFSCDSYKTVGSNLDVMRNWTDTKLGKFSPDDENYPLPGFTRLSNGPKAPVVNIEIDMSDIKQYQTARGLVENLPEEHYSETLSQVGEILEDEYDAALEDIYDGAGRPGPDDLLECVAHNCPDRMKKDFANLFPAVDINKGPFTVITISHKTHVDMSGWSQAVEEEREILLKTFIEGATEICDALEKGGFWADFIDPSSGKPYRGAYTSECFFETDERYKHFGFQIDDLGCCKVIVHKLWGTHSYIGSIFTNAPMTHPLLKEMEKRQPWTGAETN